MAITPIVPAASADDVELQLLRDQAAQLRQQLDALDARIRSLEAQKPGEQRAIVPAAEPAGTTKTSPPAATAPRPAPDLSSVTPLVQLKENWSQIDTGTPRERVLELLGKPDRELQINGKPVWYYVYPGIGRGSVFFNSKNSVSSSQPPSLGWAQ